MKTPNVNAMSETESWIFVISYVVDFLHIV